MFSFIDVWAYLFYFFIVGVVTFAYYVRYHSRSNKRIIDDFFKYTKRGRKRIPIFGEHVLSFFGLQLFAPAFVLFSGLPFYESIGIYLLVTLGIFYAYSYTVENRKKNRHNGIEIGYEYPHPTNFTGKKVSNVGEDEERIQSVVYTGSKGVYDLQLLSQPNPHIMIIGESGVGKSTTQETLLIRANEKFDIPFLILDWSGSYKSLGAYVNMWHLPDNMRINPFSLRGMKPERRAGIAAEVLQISLELTPMQAQRVRDLLNEMYKGSSEPTVKELYEIVLQEAEEEKYKEMKLQLRYIANKLSQAFEVFGEEPEAFWKNYDETCSIVELEGLTDAEKTLVTLALIQRITEEFTDGRKGKKRLNIALDDAYKAIANYYEKETPIAKIVREGRKYGFAMVISTQLLKDMPESIVSNTAMKFIHAYHDPYNIERVYKMLNMSQLEKDILYRMPTGSCFFFDLEAIQKGKVSPAFLQVDVVTEKEKKALKDRIKQVEIEKINEKAPIIKQKNLYDMTIGMDIPDVSVWRFLLALKETEQNVTNANKLLMEKGWIKSKGTLYGSTKRPSILERAISDKYFTKEGRFTDKAINILNPDRMVDAQGIHKGAELHKSMMKLTIKMIQKKGNYAFVPKEKDSFDVGEIEPDKKIKGWWNYKGMVIYEIQTNAREEGIKKCIEKSKKYKAKLIIITQDEKIEKEIKEMVKEEAEVRNIGKEL